MTRRSRILAISALVVAAFVLALVAFVSLFDWNRLRPWIAARAADALGRDVVVRGALDLDWHWRVDDDGERVWSPGFTLEASDVRISNPQWAKKPDFAVLDGLGIDIRLLPLLAHRIELTTLRLRDPDIDLERRADGANTWTFGADAASASSWQVHVGEVAFSAGKVSVVDAERSLVARFDIDKLDAPVAFGERVASDDPTTRREVIRRVGRAAAERLHDAAQARIARHGRPDVPPFRFHWTMQGTMDGEKIDGEGRFGGVIDLDAGAPFPVRADVTIGPTELALTGTIENPASPDAIHMRLWITGPNLSMLYPIVGVALPNTPPYATVGRLTGHFHTHASVLRYEDFTARVGGSDLGGTLTYRSEGERPMLSGKVASTLLQFHDLGALIGASDGGGERVLPSTPIKAGRWKAMDADVEFTGQRVVRTRELPISHVATRIRMQDGVLTLDPLTFGMAGGEVTAKFRVDANPKPPKGSVSVEAKKLALKRLFENVDGLADSLGDVRGSVKLEGRGDSVAKLLGASDGSLRVVMTKGRVSKSLIEKAGLNLANLAVAKIAGDDEVEVACAAAAFDVKDGVAKSDLFVFDTDDARIDVDGSIDLGREQVDLTLHPNTDGMRVFSLRSPLHVTGSFEHLDVSVDKKSLIARGGGAIALGIVATPIAALLPLIAPGDEDDDRSCSALLAEVHRRGASAAKQTSKR